MKPAWFLSAIVVFGAAVSHAQVFVLNGGNGTVAEVTTTGTVVAPALITGLTQPTAIAASPQALFVADASGQRIAEYSLTGAPIDLQFKTGLTAARSLALSSDGTFVYVLDGTSIFSLRADGSASALGPTVVGLTGAIAIASSGNTLDVLFSGGTVGAYSTVAGLPNHPALITGLTGAGSIAANGTDLYVGTVFVSQLFLGVLTNVAQYTTNGILVKADIAGGQAAAGAVVAAAPNAAFVGMTTAGGGAYTSVQGVSDAGADVMRPSAILPAGITGIAAVGVSIPNPPTSVTVASGQTTSFHLGALGAAPLSYQWQLNGSAIAGATDPYLLLPGAVSANAGAYTCEVTDADGLSTTTLPATLTLATSADLGRLVNVSVLAYCNPAPANVVAGFIVGGAGSGSMNTLLRAVGPELTEFGVTDAAAAASLQYYSTTGGAVSLLDSNSGWSRNPLRLQLDQGVEGAVGAFPLSAGSASSLVIGAPGPGTYTEEISTGSTPGTVLAEVYDATGSARTLSTPRLLNISARAQIGGNPSGTLDAGFVVGGSTDKTVLIRAIGPSLSGFGVSTPVPATTLSIYQRTAGGGSQQIASNSGWTGDPALASAMTQSGAFPLAANSADSAVLLTLPPGNYTASVSSPAGGTGIALVEVYDVQ